jgi:acetyl esterase/lipase
VLQVDPQVADLLSMIPPGETPFDLENIQTIRSEVEAISIPSELSTDVERQDHVVSGSPDVVIRIHRPLGAQGELPCLYSIHGGGFVMGSRVMDDVRFDTWCPKYGCIGVSVEYRLAPETPYPGPLEDCYLGLKWIYDHHDELGIDPTRIGVGGTSAGGGLAAGLALLARDRGEVPLRFQLLDCPMLDDRQTTPSSQLDDLQIWTREANSFGWQSYLGDLYGTADVPVYAAPARATDLRDLPEAYVCVGNVDGFRDEDVDYAMRLNQAGVSTELHVHPGAHHGVHLMFPETSIAQRYVQGIEEWISRHL